MDENYLDNLLNEFSLDKEIDNKIEDELDEQIQNEKDRYQEEQIVSSEEAFNLDLEQDAIDGVPDNDIAFSEDQIDELDQLDNLADLDMGNLDFSDIDFDDLDITKLSDDAIDSEFDDLLKDFEGDLEIPSFSDADNSFEESFDNLVFETNNSPQSVVSQEYSHEGEEGNESFTEEAAYEEQSSDNASSDDLGGEGADVLDNEGQESLDDDSSDDLNEDNFDADSFLDSLLEDEPIDASSSDNSGTQAGEDSGSAGEDEDGSLDDMLGDVEADSNIQSEPAAEAQSENGDLSEDDLFAMLDMDEQGGETAYESEQGSSGEMPEISGMPAGELDMSALEGLDDIEDISEKPKKKKRTFMEILFGEPDEDDEPTEEELKAIEEKKAAKKAKKEAEKEKKKEQVDKDKEEKSKKSAEKKKQDDEKKRVKAELKAKRKAEEKAEAAKEKKLNKPMVVFIFSVFLGGVGFLYLSSVDFNYKLAIENAANYFSNQKYHKAYDEIKGVDVKEKDQELKDRIYTVMYVERLYESYENNIELGRNKKALDSLLRGVSKYYEYYDDAQELDIVSDLDFSFAQIQNALQINYGITLERALEINDLDDYEYMKTVSEYTDDASDE